MNSEHAEKIFLFELTEYKRDRVQYKQTKKHPEKVKKLLTG